MLTRGTTPTLKFTIPFDVQTIDHGFLTITQYSKTVIEKNQNDWEYDGNSIILTLTQEETLLLRINASLRMQIRVVTTDGKALASQIITTNVEEILKDGAI